MPSIKSCIASLAVVAFALAPIASATPVKVDSSSLTRRTSNPSFYSNDAALEKRASAESRKEAAARIKRAKSAAAKKAKRVEKEREAEDLMKRAVSAARAAEGLTARDLEARAVFERALRRVRCGISDAVCARAVTAPTDLPANGQAVCSPSTHLCVVGCQDGFVLSGGACIASAPTCGTTTCPTTDNGVYLCAGAGVCTLVCDTANGYTATAAGTCVNTLTDAANCGAVGNVCPGSYNGVGTAACRSGLCKISCPAGTGARYTQDRSAILCYGAGTPLTAA
ncbi:hypothetical protein JCM8097_002177 [Rhodosporidiobolus ruineniae]